MPIVFDQISSGNNHPHWTIFVAQQHHFAGFDFRKLFSWKINIRLTAYVWCVPKGLSIFTLTAVTCGFLVFIDFRSGVSSPYRTSNGMSLSLQSGGDNSCIKLGFCRYLQITSEIIVRQQPADVDHEVYLYRRFQVAQTSVENFCRETNYRHTQFNRCRNSLTHLEMLSTMAPDESVYSLLSLSERNCTEPLDPISFASVLLDWPPLCTDGYHELFSTN